MQLIFALLLSVAALANQFPAETDHVINGCRVFTPTMYVAKVLPGDRCLYLPNGDLISSNSTSVRYFTALGEVKWQVDGLFHHQMNFSSDRKRILTLSSVVGALEREEERRYDELLVIDLEGKVLQRLAFHTALAAANIKSTITFNPAHQLKVKHEGSHVNSFYEIPKLRAGVKVPDYIKEGNYVVNSLQQGVLIFDRDLKRVLKQWVSPYSQKHNTHDAQITEDGTLIYFNNLSSEAGYGNPYSSVDEVDLLSNKRLLEITATPKVFFFSRHCGGVQVLNEDLVLFSHVVAGFYVYSRAKKSIVFAGQAPFASGEKLVTAQQIKVEDLTEFLKKR